MGISPFRQRIAAPGYAAPSIRTGTGERYLYPLGLNVDAIMEKRVQGTKAHIPITRDPNNRAIVLWVPPPSAQAAIGDMLEIGRGLTETDLSYAFREQRAIDDARFGGTARGVLSQILGYLLELTPTVRYVATRYDPSTFPPTALSSQWDSYPAGRDPNIEPIRTFATVANWNWDSLSPINGSWGWWGGWFVLYAVAPNAFVTPAQDWGAGSVYTPSAGGYYSTVSGGAYVAAGSYAGTSQDWGAGSVYTPSAGGYYSTVSGGAYIPSGSYAGTSQAWGVMETTDIGRSIARIIGGPIRGKSANTWVRCIVVSFDAALFDPSHASGGGVNPDGEFGQWSKVSGGAYVASRFASAVYGPEVT